MVGKMLIAFTLILSLISSILYIISYKKKSDMTVIARRLFYGVIAGIILVSGILLANILSHNFQYTYIFDNSSRQLPLYLLFASFFAGQQGSFLLWLLFFGIIGFFLIRYTKDSGFEEIVMTFYALIIVFLLLLLVMKSPFDFIWETYRDKGAPIGFKPMDGRGLNPVLENIWMVIHPPILFIGYTAVAIPFVFALAALIRNEYKKWVDIVFPWVLFASAILGLGIMLGGFWAYETLGWGGFWGWDPVENSSLLPWLTSMALVHTMIIQKKTDGLVKTNLVLAIVSFILVLYATFLTRSGILGATSVHSFSDPGSSVYFILIAILILFTVFGFFMFFLRAKSISVSKISMSFSSREFMLALGSVLILLSAVLVFIGTSWPIITDIMGMKKTSVAISFYNDTNLPIMILVLISNAICLYFSWKKTLFTGLFKKALVSLIISITATALFIISGITQFSSIILLFSIIFSFVVNVEFAIKNLRKNPLTLGGYISHIGISFLMIGILVLGTKSSSVHFRITKGEVKSIKGYNIRLLDKVQIDKHLQDRQKFAYRFEIEKKGSSYPVEPTVSFSDFNERKSPVLEPSIISFIYEDVYLVLKSSDYDREIKTQVLTKGDTISCNLDTNIKLTLRKFHVDHNNLQKNDQPLLGAHLEYTLNKRIYQDTVFTKMKMGNERTELIWRKIPHTEYDVCFCDFMGSSDSTVKSQAILTFKKSSEVFKEPVEMLTMEASFKPFISFVWLGVFIIVVGFAISLFKNLKERNEEES